jgi:hypothetical protein
MHGLMLGLLLFVSERMLVPYIGELKRQWVPGHRVHDWFWADDEFAEELVIIRT